MSTKPILMNTEKDLMQEPGAFYNGIIANITDEAIEFENRCMGEALRRWQISKEDVLARIREADKLRAENEKLRAELEYEKEHANAYYEECGQWEAENTQLKEKLEALKQDRDAVEQDFRAFAKQWWEEDSGFPCRWCKFERQGGCEWKAIHPGEICAGRAFEWRGKKED